MPELKQFGILAPALGIRKDVPSILLDEAWTSDSLDTIKQNGELHRAKKRLLEFSQVLPNAILKEYNFERPSVNSSRLIVFTKRDICYRDISNNRYQFINKLYKEGSISGVNELTASFELTFDLPTGEDLTNDVKAGDYIQIDDNTSYHTGVTWYLIESVDSSTQITCTGALPSGFSIPTGGQDYTIRKTFAGTDNDRWSVDTLNEEMVATNKGVDAIVLYTGTGQVTDLSCLVNGTNIKCKRVKAFKTRMIYIWPTIAGTEYPYEFRWSGAGDKTDLGDPTGSDSGGLAVNEGVGTLQHATEDFGFLTFWKEKAIVRAWLSGDSNVFHKVLVENIGTRSPDSLVSNAEGTYLLANDNTFRHYNGIRTSIISDPIKPIVDNINPEFSYQIQGIWIKAEDQIAWSVPYQTSKTLNRVLVLNLYERTNNWDMLDLSVCSWGEYILETGYTWNTLPFPTWNTWAWDKWNTRIAVTGNPLVLIGGYDGYIYRMYGAELDNGSAYTGYAVLETDLSKKKTKLGIFKRALMIHAYVRPESTGTMEFDVQRDNETTWQSLGPITLTGDESILIKDLPIDIRAKSLRIKPKGANRWRLIGLIIEYFEDGPR